LTLKYVTYVYKYIVSFLIQEAYSIIRRSCIDLKLKFETQSQVICEIKMDWRCINKYL
jgi:hypothetical protein